jgi:flagellar protein FliO/FliZ
MTQAMSFSKVLVRAAGKINFSLSRPSSGNLWPILIQPIMSVNGLKLAGLVLRFFSIESPRSHLNLNAILGNFDFSAALRHWSRGLKYGVLVGLGWVSHVQLSLAEESSPAPLASEPLAIGSLMRLTGGLLVVLLLVFLAAWGLRRMARIPGRGGGALRVLGGLAVGQRERVVLVQVGAEQLLLGVAPGRVEKLHLLDSPLITATESPATSSFARGLEGLLKRETKS